MTEPAQPQLDAAGFPLLEPEQIADAVLVAARSEETGQAWVCQPGRAPLQFRFPNVPARASKARRGWCRRSLSGVALPSDPAVATIAQLLLPNRPRRTCPGTVPGRVPAGPVS